MMLSLRVRPSSAKPRSSSADAPRTDASAPSGGFRDSATAGSSSRKGGTNDISHSGSLGDGLAQVPDAVFDMAMLVVVDLAVAGDTAREQALAHHEAGREPGDFLLAGVGAN